MQGKRGLITTSSLMVILVLTLGAVQGTPGVPQGKICFHSNRNGNEEIYVMNADGSGQTRLTYNSAKDSSPNWSPDGNLIIFTSNRVNQSYQNIFVMNQDGTGVTQMTFNNYRDFNPVWSPNGTYIAFDRIWLSVDSDIFRMNADGSGETPLTMGTMSDQDPNWAPDSSMILFNRSDSIGAIGNIYRMNSDGTGVTRLTNNTANDRGAVYSYDSGYIAFYSDRDGNDEIYIMKADGTGQTNLTNNLANDQLPDWWMSHRVHLPIILRQIISTSESFSKN